MHPELYYLFWAFWGIAVTGTSYWARKPFGLGLGVIIFVINFLQYLYWYNALHLG